MSAWLESAIDRAESIQDWLSPRRQQSLQLLRERQWPSRKVEDWKYTSVKAIEAATGQLQEVEIPSELPTSIAGLECIDVSLQNPSAINDLPHGVTISPINDSCEAWASELFGSIKPVRHIFGLVNDVLATEGVVIDIAPGAVIEQPIRLIRALSQQQEHHARVLVRIGEGAKATIIEQFSGDALSLHTTVAEYALDARAELVHYRFGLQRARAIALAGSHFRLGTGANLQSTIVGLGSDLSRVNVDVDHRGEHANAKLNVIYLLQGSELFDLHSTIEHAVPNCTTEENVRGIVADKSRAVFNGRIHIHRDAQKTLAELNNRNLLLSNTAEVDTKPELEIYADDVRCAHGATVAELDKKALYYMQSRGVSVQQAKIMLNFGFINELVEQMPHGELAEWLQPQLRELFVDMVSDELNK
ncbi:Fe-S cluster assembly protein SufD [Aurantivibrio plasticivorans]